MKKPEPLYLESIKKEYVWGTEEWVLSCHPQGLCRIKNEGYGGMSLWEYVNAEVEADSVSKPVKTWKEAPDMSSDFPILIKLIDARQALSVQVHPGDAYALQNEHAQGKTEMWYVLDHEPGAFLYYGLKHKVTENEFRKRIRNGSILEICRKVPVKKGDVFFIPPGMLHAIGAGIRVAEVQQSSNITYRVYDYDREDQYHQRRPLHVEQAADVLGYVPALGGHSPLGQRVRQNGYSCILLAACPYFSVWSYEVETEAEIRLEELCSGQKRGWMRGPEEKGDKGIFHPFFSLLVLKGEGTLVWDQEQRPLKEGDSVYLPASRNLVTIRGNVSFLITSP